MTQKVLVGLSGGVDSSVSAYLLKEQGYEVIGVHLLMEERNRDAQSITDAKRVADDLGIEFKLIDFTKEFKQQVIDYFVESYKQGKTPNPCIMCNRLIKFEALLEKAREMGAEYIATGHYAKIVQLDNGQYSVTEAASRSKDQTYALYRLTQDQLAHILMPIGDYEKAEARKIAQKAGLHIAKKSESQDICFVDDDDYAGYIQRALGDEVPQAGNFVNSQGDVLGEHKGITHYTVGQRRGLNLAMGTPVYVTKIDPAKNLVVVGENNELFVETLMADDLNFVGEAEAFSGKKRFLAKVRYSDSGTYCMASIADGKLLCEFEEPVKAITPGQSVVLYTDDYIALGGVIL